MARIHFLTDSAADLAKPLADQWGIEVLPFPIIMGGKEYLDGIDYAPHAFYTVLLDAPAIPTHAQLTPFTFEQAYQRAHDAGCSDLIYVSINSKASATYDNALSAREAFYEANPGVAESFSIHIMDSLTYTMAYGYAVLEGARRAAAGAGVQEIMEFITDWLGHVRILFTPLDLRFAKKSGRVSAAAAFMGEALGIKPIMTFEQGASKILSKIRGEKNVIPAILELCEKNRNPNLPYLVVRGSNQEIADCFSQACMEKFGQPPELSFFVGGVISINAGPNLVGLIYQER